MVFNHLASCQEPSEEGLAPQGAAACTGCGRGSWLQGLSLPGVCVAAQDSDVSVTWETGHRRPLGRLEISSAQLSDSEQSFRKVVYWVSWWAEAAGVG